MYIGEEHSTDFSTNNHFIASQGVIFIVIDHEQTMV